MTDTNRALERATPNGSAPVDEDIAPEEHKRRVVEFARRIDAMLWTLARTKRPSTGGSNDDK
jgi:hypothetical protein